MSNLDTKLNNEAKDETRYSSAEIAQMHKAPSKAALEVSGMIDIFIPKTIPDSSFIFLGILVSF